VTELVASLKTLPPVQNPVGKKHFREGKRVLHRRRRKVKETKR